MPSTEGIILASGSAARQAMLKQSGVEFDSIPANIDEEKITQGLSGNAEKIASILAKEKALSISKKHPEKIVIGSDQVLSLKNKIYSKAKNMAEAKQRLMELQGETHSLISAVSIAKDGQIIWEIADEALMTMKSMDSQAIDNYSKIAGRALTSCVGCYAIEGAGIRLFSAINGDYFTILGMPLLPLLNQLEQQGALK